jgi:GDPmannose 4,6-dehydratase
MKALISGISGQDGSYLSDLLLSKGYEVFGLERRVALKDQKVRNERIEEIMDSIDIIPCDITNYASVFNAIQKVMPDEVYHLAAQSFVAESWIDPFQTIDTNVTGTLNVLESIRQLNNSNYFKNIKFYFAASSEMFGNEQEPQNERTPMNPRSPYGISKLTGYQLTKNYRESYGMFACSGILFNHESPRRGKEFITKKIIEFVKNFKPGEKLELGNLDAQRDWGYSKEYVEIMWKMLQQKKPEDFVIGTGETHTIREFCEEAFALKGLNYEDYVVINQKFLRPAELNVLRADYTKAKMKLGFEPKVKFKELVRLMINE